MTQAAFDQRLIGTARQDAGRTVATAPTVLDWHMGQCIRREAPQDQRVGNRDQIVPTLSTQLKRRCGQRVTAPNQARMVQFANVSRDENIVATPSQQLNWSRSVVQGHAA